MATHNTAYAAKSGKQTAGYIPIEVIDSLKAGDIKNAIRSMRFTGSSPRSLYLLNEMQRIELFKKEKKVTRKNYRTLFNVGISYHNLYLFLKGYGIENEKFFKNALSFYRKAIKTPSLSQKNNIRLTMAALYADAGNTKTAEKLFAKVQPDLYKNKFRKYETMALYYAANGDVENATDYLEAAYKEDPKYTRLWLEISDDFNNIYDDKNFQGLLKKWRVDPLNRGGAVYSLEKKIIY